jgi:hypothetical protein
MRWGMPPQPRAGGFPVTNTRSPHWRMWLKPENRCLVPVNSFAEYAGAQNRSPEADLPARSEVGRRHQRKRPPAFWGLGLGPSLSYRAGFSAFPIRQYTKLLAEFRENLYGTRQTRNLKYS